MENGASKVSLRIEEVIPYLNRLIVAEKNTYWMEKIVRDKEAVVHLAIVSQPYLSRILSGEKTIESRYSINLIAPYNKIREGDIVLLKKTGGEVIAIFEAGAIRFFSIDTESDLEKIKEDYNDQLKIDDTFWNEKKNCNYATLIDIRNLWKVPHFNISKKNRSAWMILGKIAIREEVIQLRLDLYPNVICVVGKIASGKTYVSKTIADRNQWLRCSTSDFLRDILCKNGENFPSREQLQELGEIEINKGWSVFARDFMNYAMAKSISDYLIIDGIRHIEFFDEVKNIVFPKKCILIYLDIPQEIIRARLKERGEKTIDFEHIAEGSQVSLFNAADFISDGSIDDVNNFIKMHFMNQ